MYIIYALLHQNLTAMYQPKSFQITAWRFVHFIVTELPQNSFLQKLYTFSWNVNFHHLEFDESTV